ncbi:hypothetical protein SCALM49S_05283 [Streptomyces californicus]
MKAAIAPLRSLRSRGLTVVAWTRDTDLPGAGVGYVGGGGLQDVRGPVGGEGETASVCI